MQPDDPVDPPVPVEVDAPVPPDVGEPPRLRRPAAFRAAKERIRQRDAWLALSDDERARCRAALADHEQDQRYQKTRARLLALVDDGGLATFLIEAARFMSRRGLALLKRRAKLDGREGRHARWLLVLATGALAKVQAEARPPAPDDPDAPDAGPRVQVHVNTGKPGAVRTQWAKPGDLC